MSRSRISTIIVSAFVLLLVTASWFPAEAQLRRLRRAAQGAVEREVARQVDRAVTGMVRCAFNDPACIEKAKEDGDAVEITDEDGNVLRDANGNPISDPEYAEASQQKPGEGAWRNYDFVPGDRTLFYEDFTNDNVGDFPRRIEFLAGNMEVVDSDGLRILRVTAGSQRDAQFAIPLPESLPERFTLEFPVHWASRNLYVRVYFEADGASKPPAGGTYQLPHLVVDARRTGIYDWQEDSPIATEQTPQIHDGWVTVRLMADGDHVKAYVNEKRVANVPQAQLGRDSRIWFTLRDGTDEVPIFVGPITVAAGGRDLYDRLEAEGSVATRGILFATDSDEILPESTPVLAEIGDMLRDHPDLRLGITGHTDSQGSDEYNLNLSNRRAASVVRYLIDAYGIGAERLESEGLGETAPVDTNDSAEGRANNRRVELRDLREDASQRSESAGNADAAPAASSRGPDRDGPVVEEPDVEGPDGVGPDATDSAQPAAAPADPGAGQGKNGSLRLTMGTETTDFEVTYCSVDPRVSGQNHVEADLTAVGIFRGRPAALFLWKVTDARFENIDIYLTDLSADVRAIPPMQAFRRITDDRQTEFAVRGQQLESEFQESLSRPGLTPEQMTAASDAFGKESDELNRQFALSLPWVRYFGAITVEGSGIRFQATGQKSINPDEGVPEFAGLPDDVRVVASCGSTDRSAETVGVPTIEGLQEVLREHSRVLGEREGRIEDE